MVAKKIDGTAIAKSIREKINADIEEKQRSNPRFKPSLVIIQGTRIDCHALANITDVINSRRSSRFEYVSLTGSQASSHR
jgi:5,10-methylene-tetrahydrofolate dehydrogenase/methenyl tetrahydrofolate cyclohydrolase